MPSRRPWTFVVIGALVVLAIVAWLVLAPRLAEEETAPVPRWSEPAAMPPVAASPTPNVVGMIDAEWVDAAAEATGIPRHAMAVYAGVQRFQADFRPDCGLSWTIIAAIGYVESRHGSHNGSSIQEDGTVSPPIYGIALSGGETDHIPDSDSGQFDGDAEFDRAMGPMQMIPESWRNWGYDGNFDGIVDPQNIDDASHAAANYLCRASSAGLDTEEGWREGVSAYNSNPAYIDSVATAAERYRLDVDG